MTPTEIVDEFIARVVRRDLDAACELVTDDVEYDNVPMGKNHGPQGIKDVFAILDEPVTELEFVVHRQTATGNVVMNERTDRFRIGDQWWDIAVCGVFEVTGDKISLWRDYFDMAEADKVLAAALG